MNGSSVYFNEPTCTGQPYITRPAGTSSPDDRNWKLVGGILFAIPESPLMAKLEWGPDLTLAGMPFCHVFDWPSPNHCKETGCFLRRQSRLPWLTGLTMVSQILGYPDGVENGRCNIDNMVELVAYAALVLDYLRSGNGHALLGAAEMRGHHLGPRERRIECPGPANRHVRIGLVGPGCRVATGW